MVVNVWMGVSRGYSAFLRSLMTETDGGKGAARVERHVLA